LKLKGGIPWASGIFKKLELSKNFELMTDRVSDRGKHRVQPIARPAGKRHKKSLKLSFEA